MEISLAQQRILTTSLQQAKMFLPELKDFLSKAQMFYRLRYATLAWEAVHRHQILPDFSSNLKLTVLVTGRTASFTIRTRRMTRPVSFGVRRTLTAVNTTSTSMT